jgi:hypothetical protein
MALTVERCLMLFGAGTSIGFLVGFAAGYFQKAIAERKGP